jgi:hypothetical protein
MKWIYTALLRDEDALTASVDSSDGAGCVMIGNSCMCGSLKG